MYLDAPISCQRRCRKIIYVSGAPEAQKNLSAGLLIRRSGFEPHLTNHDFGVMAHSFSLTSKYRPNMTKILLTKTKNHRK